MPTLPRSPRLVLAGDARSASQLLRDAPGWAGPVGVLGRTPGEAGDAAATDPASARPLASAEALREARVVVLSGPPGEDLVAFASGLRLHETGAVVILAGAGPTSKAPEIRRACGVPARRLLATGCLPDQLLLEGKIARRTGISRCQVVAPVIGRPDGAFMPLSRYLRVAGLPLEVLDEEAAAEARGVRTAGGDELWSRAALLLARSVMSDRRAILTCSAFHPALRGLPEGFYSLPSTIGGGGLASGPCPGLTLEERTFLTGA